MAFILLFLFPNSLFNFRLSLPLICSPFLLASQRPSKLNYSLKLNFSLNKEKFLWLILSSYLGLRAIVKKPEKA